MKTNIYFCLWNKTNLINLIGIHIYLMIFYYYINIIPLIVYFNGIITHLSNRLLIHKNIRKYF